MSLTLFNHRWYYNLLKKDREQTLEHEFPNFRTDGSFVVQWVLPPKGPNANVRRVHGRFTTFMDFFRYMELPDLLDHLFTFFELLSGQLKGFFDVDLSRKYYPNVTREMAEEMLGIILDAIFVVFQKYGITLSAEHDVLLFENSDDTKFSYHIIIDNYCFTDITECKSLYKDVVSQLDSSSNNYFESIHPPNEQGESKKGKFSSFIDENVYKKLQFFRLLWSGKSDGMDGRKRIKQFREKWIFRGNDIVHRYRKTPKNERELKQLQFESSLVSLTASCKLLSPFSPKEEKEGGTQRRRLSPNARRPEITDEKANLMFSLFEKKLPEVAPHFTIREIHENKIDLLRINPCFCPICKREHESQNAKIQIWKGVVTFHCYQKSIVGYPLKDANDIIELLEETKEKIELVEEKKEDSEKKKEDILKTTEAWNNNVLANLLDFSRNVNTKNTKNEVNSNKKKEKGLKKKLWNKAMKKEYDSEESENENQFLNEEMISKCFEDHKDEDNKEENDE